MRPCQCDNVAYCRLCWLWHNDPAYKRLWGSAEIRTSCKHLGPLIATEQCQTCNGRVELKVFACDHPVHLKTTIPQCNTCPDWE
jgi:hypothetical protein